MTATGTGAGNLRELCKKLHDVLGAMGTERYYLHREDCNTIKLEGQQQAILEAFARNIEGLCERITEADMTQIRAIAEADHAPAGGTLTASEREAARIGALGLQAWIDGEAHLGTPSEWGKVKVGDVTEAIATLTAIVERCANG